MCLVKKKTLNFLPFIPYPYLYAISTNGYFPTEERASLYCASVNNVPHCTVIALEKNEVIIIKNYVPYSFTLNLIKTLWFDWIINW